MITTYLDTANWIDLAEGNCRALEFERAVYDKKIRPILSLVHLLELAKQEERSWRRVARYIDHIKHIGDTSWIRLRGAVESLEVQAAYGRFLGVSVPSFSVFADSLVDVLPRRPGEDTPEELRCDTVENQVESLSANSDYLNIYLPERDNYQCFRNDPRRDPVERALDYLPITPPKGHPNVRVTPELRDQFRAQLDIMQLPAFSMVITFNKGWSKKFGGRKLSDYDDHLHLVGLAYSQVGFADVNTCEALKTGKRVPKRNGEFAGWAASL